MGAIVSFLITWTVIFYLYYRLVKAYYRGKDASDEMHHCTTPDGWRLSLKRYTPSQPDSKRYPVLLLHGLGSSARGFELGDDIPALPTWLKAKNWDVWAADLRGHGLSEHPTFFSEKRYGWNFDDYLNKDLPTLIEHILKQTGASKVHWIGHSMGGILALSALAHPQLKNKLASVTTIASSLNYSTSKTAYFLWKKYLSPLKGLLPAVPMNWIALLCAPIAGRFPNQWDRFSAVFENIKPRHLRRLYARTFSPISTPVLLQLESVLDSKGLVSNDNSIRYSDALSRTELPTLTLAGDKDIQCPLEAVELTFNELPEKTRKKIVFPNTGHWDLLIGKESETKVFPEIEEFLTSSQPQL